MSSSSSAWEKRIALNATPTLVGRPIRSRRLQGFSTTASQRLRPFTGDWLRLVLTLYRNAFCRCWYGSVTQGVEVLRKPEPL